MANARKDPLTPRYRAIVHDVMDELIAEANQLDSNGKRPPGNIYEKVRAAILADPMKHYAETERREQAQGAPREALGGPAIDIKALYLTAVQSHPGDSAKLVESSGTERVPDTSSHWDH